MRKRPGWRALVAVLATVTMVAAACGDDDDDTDATGTDTSAETGTGTEDGAEVDLVAFCNAVIAAEQIFIAGPEADEATGEPTPEDIEQFGAELQPHLDVVEANTPPDIETEVDTVLAAVNEALSTGDESATDTPEFFEAEGAVDNYVYDNCETDDQIDVTGVDYAFEGAPESVGPGRIGLRLNNEGEELHEAVVFRIVDEQGRSIEELFELPEEEVEELIEFKGIAFAAPGESGATVLDIQEAGQYALVCFIPVGTTSLEEAEGPEGEEGPPHFAEGMFAEFTVS